MVEREYPKTANFVRSKYSKSTILSVCDVLCDAHEKGGRQHRLQLSEMDLLDMCSPLLSDPSDKEESNKLFVFSLCKMGIIVLRKTDGTTFYEFGSCFD